MDLTFTDRNRRDVGLVSPTEGDLAWGEDENDFSLDVAGRSVPPEDGLLYLDGSDVGGVVRGYTSRTDLGYFSVVGDTWTGVLDSHVLRPPPGQAYYSVAGDAASCVASVIARIGLSDLFSVRGSAGVVVSHTFRRVTQDESQRGSGRYMGGWQAIWQLLLDHGLAISFAWDSATRRVAVTVSPRLDLTGDEAWSAGAAEIGVSRQRPCNHLVCLGGDVQGERDVIDLYMDSRGVVGTTQTQFGLDEVAQVYDDNNHEGDELRAAGTKKLRELWGDSQEVTIAASSGLGLRIGDLVGGTDARTGVDATAVVSKRVLSFHDGIPSWSYSSKVRG